ncbi:MAG: Vgb family protein [Gaiellales bacterium]
MTPTTTDGRRRRLPLRLALAVAAGSALLAVPLAADAATFAPTAATVANSAITEYATPSAYAGPLDTALGADGRIWLTEQYGGKIAAITTSGTFTETALPDGQEPLMITPFLGIDDAPPGMFFTAFTASDAGEGSLGITSLSGALYQYTTPSAPARSFVGVTLRPGDNTIWVGDTSDGTISRITGADTTTFPISTPDSDTAMPIALAAAADGSIWFTDWHDIGYIGKLSADGATSTEYELRTETGIGHAADITPGPDGNMWFTVPDAKVVGKITSAGVITLFPVGVAPGGITAGPDGNLWFTTRACGGGGFICTDAATFYDTGSAKLGRITPTRDVSLNPLPTPTGGGWGISSGADGNLWFTETDASKIGTMSPSPLAPPAPTAVSGPSSATVTMTATKDSPAPTSYVVTSSPGGRTCTATVAAGSCVVNGLLNDKAYTFTAVATNTAPRPSAASPASRPVTVGRMSVRFDSATRNTITTTFNAPGVGWIYQHAYVTQQDRASSSKQVNVCATSKKATKAGKTKIVCTLTKAARKARRQGTLAVSMVTTFVATGKTPSVTATTLSLRRR